MNSRQDLEGLLAELKMRVAKRRQEGEYPPELEEDLARHFRNIALHRRGPSARVDRSLLVDLAEAADFSRSRIDVNSAVPGGRQVHRAVRKLVGRQVDGIFAQLSDFTMTLRQLLDQMALAIEEISAYTRRDLGGQIELAVDHVAKLEARLQQIQSNQPLTPHISYRKFQEEFRGTHEELLENYREIANLFDGPVLDVGCGTGALLELLRERDVEAEGVDADPEMVDAALSLGLRAAVGDLFEKLRNVADASLGGIAAIQVVEQLQPRQVVDLVSLTSKKLRPGGKFVVDAINPQALEAHARSLYLDPMNVRPVHPSYLEFLAKQVGFLKSEIHWPAAPDGGADTESTKEATDKFDRIYNLVFGPPNYLFIATR